MKIGLLTSWMSHYGGGVVDAVHRMASSLQATPEFQVAVFGLADREGAGERADWMGTSAIALPTRGPRGWGYAPMLTTMIARSNIDLLHVHGLWMYPSVASLSWVHATGRPHMITPHGMLDSWAVRNSRWKKRIALWAYERRHLESAGCLHALCDAEVEAMRAFGLRNPVCVVPNSISLLAHGDAGHEVVSNANPKTLLYLGRLHPKKGLTTLLRAWHRFDGRRDQGGDWQLVVAGWDQGGYERELRQLAEMLSINGSVRFSGPQFGADKDALFRSATAFVLPSVSEGLPMVVLEAWSYRLPVLMTRHCNLPEGLAAGAALAIGSDDEGIAQGLKALARMTDLDRQRMGERGAKLCEERFSPQHTSDKMKEVYRWLMRVGPRPGCVVVG
jgi:glycosyltransferase involved in cell wall biosynthesis